MTRKTSETTLEIWLTEATRGLAADSVAQIRAEITEHYTSACEAACEAALASGATREEAAPAALRSLGDARQANRLYRRSMLTTTERWYLQYLRKHNLMVPSTWNVIGMGWMVVMHLLVAVSKWDHGERTSSLAAFGAALLWGFVWYRVSLILKMPDRARRLRRGIHAALFAELVLLPALIGGPWLTVVLFVFYILNLRLHESIRRKLPKEQCPVAIELF